MAMTDSYRGAVIAANVKPDHSQIPPASDGVTESPTCDSDLVGGTGVAGKHQELLCLVHGVVGAGNDQSVSRPPGLHVVLQGQDGAVYVGVDGDGEFGPHCNRTGDGDRAPGLGRLPPAFPSLPD